MRRSGPGLAAALLSLAVPPALQARAAPPSTPAADYLRRARAEDAFVIRASRFMLMTSKNPDIVKFADRMITDHRTSSTALRRAARSDKVPGGAGLDADGRRILAELKAASGPARMRLYLDQQEAAHRASLALHRAYAISGTSPSLVVAAGKLAPLEQIHVDLLRQLRTAM